jgi:hypothetical protein
MFTRHRSIHHVRGMRHFLALKAARAAREAAERKLKEEAKDEMSEAFGLFGLTTEATEDEIKRAAKALAKQFHPDKGGDPEEFKAMMETRDSCLLYVERARGEE